MINIEVRSLMVANAADLVPTMVPPCAPSSQSFPCSPDFTPMLFSRPTNNCACLTDGTKINEFPRMTVSWIIGHLSPRGDISIPVTEKPEERFAFANESPVCAEGSLS